MSPRRSAHPRCPHCAFRGDPCFCPEIPRIDCRLQLTIVRHAAEIGKQTNSARWAALALGCPIVDYAASEAPFDARGLPARDAWILFPGSEPSAAPRVAPRHLIVPDGTWQQARRMVARVPALRALPRLTLPPAPVGPRLRRPHEPHGMSTLEAIAGALAWAGEPGPAAALLGVHEAMLRRAVRLRGWQRTNWAGADPVEPA